MLPRYLALYLDTVRELIEHYPLKLRIVLKDDGKVLYRVCYITVLSEIKQMPPFVIGIVRYCVKLRIYRALLILKRLCFHPAVVLCKVQHRLKRF